MTRHFLYATLMATFFASLFALPARACDGEQATTPAGRAEVQVKLLALHHDAQPPMVHSVVAMPVGDFTGGLMMTEPQYMVVNAKNGTATTGAGLWVADAGGLSAAPEADQNRGWLGVQISDVPKSTADQLDLKDEGVAILNVVEGSPADKIGLKQNDIIVEINGKTVEGGVPGLVQAIATHQAGETVDLTILRDNKRMIFEDVELDSRQASTGSVASTWKFQFNPTEEIEDLVITRGKLMMQDENGNWVMHDLGDIGDMDDLPKELSQMLPKSGAMSMRSFDHTDGSHVTAMFQFKNSDGENIQIESNNDGPIVVTRTDADGNVTTNEYASDEALQQADPEAHSMMHDHMHFITDDDGQIGVHVGSLPDNVAQLRDLTEAQRAEIEATRRRFETEMAKLQGAQVEILNNIPLVNGMQGATIDAAPPKHTFEQMADGSIEVRIRKGDSELLRRFSNEDDLANRDADLYAKYQDLMDADAAAR